MKTSRLFQDMQSLFIHHSFLKKESSYINLSENIVNEGNIKFSALLNLAGCRAGAPWTPDWSMGNRVHVMPVRIGFMSCLCASCTGCTYRQKGERVKCLMPVMSAHGKARRSRGGASTGV